MTLTKEWRVNMEAGFLFNRTKDVVAKIRTYLVSCALGNNFVVCPKVIGPCVFSSGC